MRVPRPVLALWLLSLGASCGVDPNPDAVMKCEALRAAICGRKAGCVSGLAPGSCERQFDATLACGKAVSVGHGYDQCMKEVAASPCQALFSSNGAGVTTLPGSCGDSVYVAE